MSPALTLHIRKKTRSAKSMKNGSELLGTTPKPPKRIKKNPPVG